MAGSEGLENSLLPHTIVHGNSCDTGCYLGNNVGNGVVGGDAAIPESGGGDGGIEMPSTDAADQENQDGECRTNCPRIASGDDDGDKNKRANGFYKNGKGIHPEEYFY